MRYIFLTMILFFLISCNENEEGTGKVGKQETATATNRISPEMLSQADTVMSTYYLLKNAFVEADSIAVDKAAKEFSGRLVHFENAAQKDSLSSPFTNGIYSLQIHTDSLIMNSDLLTKRRSFSVVSDTLFSVLKQMQYSNQLVYRQVCPMAFNDAEAAHWLSQYSEVENPYLGKKHPKYGAGMLHCGELIDSVNYSR